MADQPYILSLYDKVKSGGRRAAANNPPASQTTTPAPKPQQPAQRATKKRAAAEDAPKSDAKRTKRAKRPTKTAAKKTKVKTALSPEPEQPLPPVATPANDPEEGPSAGSKSPASHRDSTSVRARSTPQDASTPASQDTRQTSMDSQTSLLDGNSRTALSPPPPISSNSPVDPSHNSSAGAASPVQPASPTTSKRAPAPIEDASPVIDTCANTHYVHQLRTILEGQAGSRVNDYRRRHALMIGALLKKAQAATEDEILCLDSAGAKEAFRSGIFHDMPVLTNGQQPLPLQTVDNFLGEYYDDKAKLFVQDSSVKIGKDVLAVRQVTIDQIKQRLAKEPSEHPWNCLELATHVEDGLRPRFLDDEDCRLLTKLKIPATYGNSGRRVLPPDYKEVEKWGLLAEGGAHTEPHQDSHGYSTYITVNQGEVGFGWMSQPSADDRKNWLRNIYTEPYDVGNYWRYVVLRPGQTVTFPAGTVHFVFRLPSAGHSLSFGGHFLRCSNLVHWVKAMIEQKKNRNISNEDLSSTAHGHLDRVETFVRQALQNGTTAKWGGPEATEEFLKLKEEFMRAHKGKKA